MQANKLQSKAAIFWLKESWKIFLTQPSLLFLATFTYWFLLSLVSSIPIIGVILPSVLLPLFSLAMMEIVRAVIEKRELRVLKYFMHRDKDMYCIRRLLLAGLLNFLYLIFIIFTIAQIFNFDLWLVASGQKVLTNQIITADGFIMAIILTTIFLMPAVAASWYAPMLIAWDNLSVLQAFTYSIIAVWRNIKAFLFYFAILVFTMTVLRIVAQLIYVTLSVILTNNILINSFISMLPLFFIIFIAPTIFVSFYLTYQQVFLTATVDK